MAKFNKSFKRQLARLKDQALRTGGEKVREDREIGNKTEHALSIKTDDEARIRITAAGKVGIGITEDEDIHESLTLPSSPTRGAAKAHTWKTYSSAEFKENVREINNALETVKKLKGVKYNWISDEPTKDEIGFIAEDVNIVLPEVVTLEDGETGEKKEVSMDYSRLTSVLVEAVKEQDATITGQTKNIEELTDKIESILNFLDQ